MKLSNQFLFLFVFLVFVLLISLSCQKDDKLIEQNVNIVTLSKSYDKNELSYETLKRKLGHYEEFDGLNIQNRGLTNDYIIYIDTTYIIEFSNDSISTYTMRVLTNDQDYHSFTNILLIEKDNELNHGLLKYTPSEFWINSYLAGNSMPFEGIVSLIDDEGKNLASNEIIDGIITMGFSESCSFTITEIWQSCYGSSCPCTDGNGYLAGWEINGGCTWGGSGSSGGSGGDGSGPGGGGNGGGSGGSGTGDLPTDPIEWAIFMQLHALLGPGTFYLDSTIDPNEAIHFDSFEDFEDFFTEDHEMDSDLIDNQDGTHTSKFTLQKGLPPFNYTINIDVNQTLKNHFMLPTQNYIVHSITTGITGGTFANWQNQSFDITIDQIENIATINIYGDLGFKVGIGGLHWNLYSRKHFRIKIRTTTGFPLDFIEIE